MGFYRVTGRRRHSYCYLRDFSEIKNGREMLEILLASVKVEAYLVIIKIHFSPKVISITPSSQPKLRQPVVTSSDIYKSEAP